MSVYNEDNPHGRLRALTAKTHATIEDFYKVVGKVMEQSTWDIRCEGHRGKG